MRYVKFYIKDYAIIIVDISKSLRLRLNYPYPREEAAREFASKIHTVS